MTVELPIINNDSASRVDRQRVAFHRLFLPSTALCLLGVLYLLLYNSYRAYEIDNPWYLSFSRNFWVDYNNTDYFLHGVFPDGMGGTPVFGRTAALLQAVVLSHTGWFPFPATLLSIGVVLAGLFIWGCFLKQQGVSPIALGSMLLALGLTEPFVGMAERFRFEPYSFFLMAVAFWLASIRRPWIALCVALTALEIEPAACLIFPAVAFYLVRSRLVTFRQAIYGTFVALVFFVSLYMYLHPGVITILRDADWHRGSSQREAGGFVRAYFLDRKRHLPEFALVLLAGLTYWRQRCKAPLFVCCMAEITGFVCVASFLMRWPTPAYMIFFFPFFFIVAMWVLETRGSSWMLAGILALYMLPQYGILAVVNYHEGWRSEDIRKIADVIRHSENVSRLDDSKAQIMGDYSLWYAHPEHYRALAKTTGDFSHSEDLYLCFEKPLRQPSMVDPIVQYCQDIEARVALREVERAEIRGHQLLVLVPR